MIVFFALALPLLIAILKLLFFRRRMAWWEYLVPSTACILIILPIKCSVVKIGLSDKEFYGHYMQEAWYYQGWDEWIDQTCYRTVTDSEGNESEEAYDCSYEEEHGPYWEIRYNTGLVRTIEKGGTLWFGWSKKTFDGFERLAKLNGNRKFVDMHRDHNGTDGDAYRVSWNGDDANVRTWSTEETWANRVQVASTVHDFREISEREKKDFDLKDYPRITKGRQQMILGARDPTVKEAERQLQITNALLGKRKKVRAFILLYKNQPEMASHLQESLWERGNLNEFVLTIGVDDHWKVDWVRVFSWTEADGLIYDCRRYIEKTFIDSRSKLDLRLIVSWLRAHLASDWIKKEKSDFDYLTVNPPLWGTVLCFMLTLLISGVTSAWTLHNEFVQCGHEAPSDWRIRHRPKFIPSRKRRSL